MDGQESSQEAGWKVTNDTGGNSEPRGIPHNFHASRTYYSPFSHPDLEYVYQGSPRDSSVLVEPDFSIAYNHPNFLQFIRGNDSTYDPALVTTVMQPAGYPGAPGGSHNFQASEQSPIAHGLYNVPSTPELQFDDFWAGVYAQQEADLFAQESVQQFNNNLQVSGDLGMIEAFGIDSGPSPSAVLLPAVPVMYCRNSAADDKTWAILSQGLPEVGVDGASSSGQAGFSSSGQASLASPSTANTSMRTEQSQSQGYHPSRHAQHVADLTHNSNPGSYPIRVDEFGDTTMDMMNIVMGDTISDGVSSTGDPSWREVAPSQQYPHGYSVRNNHNNDNNHSNNTTTGPSAVTGPGGQISSSPGNNISNPQSSQPFSEQRDPHRTAVSAGSAGFSGGAMTTANDFSIMMMEPELSGIRQLGEPQWALQLLNLCAAAIASQNITRVQHLMWLLNDLASVQGDVNQRYAAYGLRAVYMRITKHMDAIKTFLRPRHYDQEVQFGPKMVHRALVKFHEHVPWHQNCYSASSQTLLEVCAGKSRLHLIDIGAGKGIEWPIFIDALVSRPGGPPSILRITMIKDRRREESTHNTKNVSSEAADFMTRLVKFASVLGLHVEVNVIGKALECVTREDLRLRHGEILAVVCQFRLHRLGDEVPKRPNNSPPSSEPLLSPRDEFLDFLFTLNPHVMIMSDNDVDHCPPDFLSRFQNAVGFWWSFFESMDMGYAGRDTQERQIIEYEAASMLLNKVACEGGARIERNEPSHRWARRIMRAGFVRKDLSDEVKKICQNLVHNHGDFWDVVFSDQNCVHLRWRKQPMTFTSIWATPGHCSKHSCKCSMLHN